ncbi:insulinase family protein [Arenimonas sp.]|nr:insulinase family protein [Candidatus Parcubacteria bacterium]
MTTYFKEDPYLFTEDYVGGVPFYYKHIATAPCVHIRIVFDYGAMHDEPGFEGAAHLLEHTMLKGSDLIEDEKAYQEFSKKYTLGTANASTSLYKLQLTGKCLPQHIEHVLNVYFASIISPKFDHEAVESEKKVIIQEFWRYYTNETYLKYVNDLRVNNLFEFPDYLRTNNIIGWVDTIQKNTFKDLKKAKEKFLVKNNLRIFVAGNLEKLEDIKKIINSNLEKMILGEKSIAPVVPSTIEKPKQNMYESKYIDIGLGDEEQAGIEAEIIIPKFDCVSNLKKIATQHLLVMVINDLVYEKLRTENKLCYSAGAGTGSRVTFQSVYIQSKLNPEYIEKSISLIKEIIEGVSDGIFEDKFNKNKELIIDRFISSERVTNDILDSAVNSYINYDHNLLLNDLIDAMEKVTYQDTVEFSKEYLPVDKFVFEILKPKTIKTTIA